MKWSIVGWMAAVIFVLGGGAYAWLWFAGGSGEPSTDLTTPTIAGSDTTTPAPDTTNAPTATITPGTTEEPAGPASFVLDSTRSVARFELDEELRGSPQHVVGVTDQVAGQVLLDPENLTTVEFSEIVVNARTFDTGSAQRDRAIRGPVILNSASDEFEFITFLVTSAEGLPSEVSVGETIELSVTGDLTIRGVTNEETFQVVATLADAATIEGTADTTISRDAYGIGIPNVPSVANVSDEVVLALDFVLSSN